MPTKTQKERRRAKQRKRRNEQRKLLREARAVCRMTAQDIGDVDPVEAMTQVLNRAHAQLVIASTEVDNLPADELWRDTMAGRIPNEWIRLETELKREVAFTASKMLGLDIESRKANAAEVVAGALAPVLGEVFKHLKLSKAQQAKAKEVVAQELRLLEGGREAEAA